MPPPLPAPYYYTPPRADPDADHLRLLSIFHYALAGLDVFGGLFTAANLFFLRTAFARGLFFPANAPTTQPDLELFNALFTGIAIFSLVLAIATALLKFFAGRCLARRRGYTFCFVVACIECISMPLGTALGVFTIIVLGRPSVKLVFGRSTPGGPPPLPKTVVGSANHGGPS